MPRIALPLRLLLLCAGTSGLGSSRHGSRSTCPGMQTAPACTRPPQLEAAAATAGREGAFTGPPYDYDAMLSAYNTNGYVLVRGLIPPDVVNRAGAAVWQEMRRQYGWRRDDPSSWPVPGPGAPPATPYVGGPAVRALWTPAYLRLAEKLSAGYVVEAGAPGPASAPAPASRRRRARIQAPMGSVMSINVFPARAAVTWRTPEPHIDHSLPGDDHRAFPRRPVRIASMAYLSESGALVDAAAARGGAGGGGGRPLVHGGSTVIWPGSNRLLEQLAKSDPARFERMAALSDAMMAGEAGVGAGSDSQPIEIQHRAGDVLFYDIFTAHAGSLNTSPTPRLAINLKWS
jgi:hypothetical protein